MDGPVQIEPVSHRRRVSPRPSRARRWILCFLVIGAVVAVWIAWPTSKQPSDVEKADRYPELADVDQDLFERISAALPVQSGFNLHWIFDHPILKSWSGAPPGIIEQAGPEAATALLRALIERDKGPGSPFQVTPNLMDERFLGIACWLRENADAASQAILLRMVRDAKLSDNLRLRTAVAACRPGHREALDPLVDTILDYRNSGLLRQEILLRLPRLELPLPERLADLLYLPYRGLDILAAGAFAHTGDLRAPSLIVTGLGFRNDMARKRALFLSEGVLVIARDNPPVADHALGIFKHKNRRAYRERAKSAAVSWLAEREDTFDSPFEEECRHYRTVTGPTRDMAHVTWDEIRSADEDDLDFGAALLHLTEIRDWNGERVDTERYLEPLDRLCRLVARDLGGKSGPDQVLRVLRRRLQPDRPLQIGWAEEAPSCFLPVALDGYAANCAGLTALTIAVADRLDLPLFAVASPEHIFVRWDDGTTRRNLELTEGAAVHPDSHYETLSPTLRIARVSVKQGVFLRNLTRKETLGYLLYNNAAFLVTECGDRDRALEFVKHSLELAPLNPLAIEAGAREHYRRWTGNPVEGARAALAELARSRRLHPLSLSSRLSEASIFLDIGEVEEARRIIEAIQPESLIGLRAVGVLARLYCATGRSAMALELLDGALSSAPENRTLKLCRLQVLAVLDTTPWRKDLILLLAADPFEPAWHLSVAAALLDAGPTRVEDARNVLKQVSYLEADTIPGDERLSEAPAEVREHLASLRPVWYDLMARALDLGGVPEAAKAFRESAGEARKDQKARIISLGWWEKHN